MVRQFQYYQGDIAFIPRSDVDLTGATEVARDPRGRLVVAEGEATGHAHAVLTPEAKLVEKDGVLYLVTTTETDIVHDEHDVITFDPEISEIWEVRRQQEYTPAGARYVAD